MILKKLCFNYPQMMFYFLQPFEKNTLIKNEIYKKILCPSHSYLISSMEKFYETLSTLLVY